MAITQTQVERLLVLGVGDTPDGRLLANVDLLWQQAAWAGTIYPPLQTALVRLGLIDLAIGYYRDQVDTTLDGLSIRYQQKVATLLTMRADAQDLIARYQKQGQASRAGTAQPITQTQPVLPPVLRPELPDPEVADAFAERVQGSPYFGQELDQQA